jgi:uncharacterized membrane protein YfcA
VLTALAGALAIGLSLGLLGSGGSILTVPVLHYLLGQPEQAAIGGSLLVVGAIAAAAALPYARTRQVSWRQVLWFGAPGMAGAWAGASLAPWIPGIAQLAGFALVVLAASWRMLAGGVVGATGTVVPTTPRPAGVVASGAFVGLLSGTVGVGGGFLIVPALVLVARVPMHQAVGTSLAVIAINALTGFAKYRAVLEEQGIDLDWSTLALVAGIGIAASFAGHRLGRKLPQATLRRIFGSVLAVLGTGIAAHVAIRSL